MSSGLNSLRKLTAESATSSAFVPIDLSKVPFRKMRSTATLMHGGASGYCAKAKTSSLRREVSWDSSHHALNVIRLVTVDRDSINLRAVAS